MKKVGIICTIGPASDAPTVLAAMSRAGMDIGRLNFSHGTHDEHAVRIRRLRALKPRPLVLQDLEGHRIRVGRFQNGEGIMLKAGKVFSLTTERMLGNTHLVPLDYEAPLDVRPGSFIYIDDGNLALKVLSDNKKRLKVEALVPGFLKERKGVNIPGFRFPREGLTAKDRADLDFGIAREVDWIAQSFVRDASDVRHVRERLHETKCPCKLIAKIENAEGVRNAGRILDVADGLMVARGDLGVSVPIHQIPVIQKKLIRLCNRRKKIVITATHMLESMTEHRRPTRAEVTDVANAVLDGSDFVMLSGETAAGKYPVEAVDMMRKIVRYTQDFKNSLGTGPRF